MAKAKQRTARRRPPTAPPRPLLAVLSVPLSQLYPSPHNYRFFTDAEAMTRLAASIAAHGIHTPLFVRRDPVPAAAPDPEELPAKMVK